MCIFTSLLMSEMMSDGDKHFVLSDSIVLCVACNEYLVSDLSLSDDVCRSSLHSLFDFLFSNL